MTGHGSDSLRKTPLHGRHVELGGKMVPFAGWEMPIQYEAGIRAEHRAVRTRAGLFDVSHMGEVVVRGPEALAFLRHLAVNDASRLEEGQAQYSALCRPDGGVLDDLVVYRFPDRFMLVVNAANRETDLEWIREHAADYRVEVEDRSAATALLALQGPWSESILAVLTDVDLDTVPYYRFTVGAVAGIETVVSRTGYTGEDGFELYTSADEAPELWDALLDAGSKLGTGTEEGLLPAGLGARDSLRLEMGYALHGQDVDVQHTPLEAGLGWIVRLDGDRSFIGSDVLREQKSKGVGRKLVGIGLEDRGFPRPGYEIVLPSRDDGDTGDDASDGDPGAPVGTVTSGTVSPTLERGIALGYVPAEHAPVGTGLAIRIRDRDVPGRVEKLPFYTDGSIKR
ncbi:MAG: glycine cleavage system aminomethyltransferase GcvT [Longimicrobiales bacterium]|nr:glycine cleavage system aminomethyltransferase GcvT [Longimicrobiales bacterium]